MIHEHKQRKENIYLNKKKFKIIFQRYQSIIFLWMLFSILTRTIMYNFNGNSMPWINKLMKIFSKIFFSFYVYRYTNMKYFYIQASICCVPKPIHKLYIYIYYCDVMLNKQGKKNFISFGNFNSIIFMSSWILVTVLVSAIKRDRGLTVYSTRRPKCSGCPQPIF